MTEIQKLKFKIQNSKKDFEYQPKTKKIND